jgi:hypothetical protein
MTEEELYRLYYEARVELAKYPGVAGVGLGLKERRGQLTDETSFRVYVYEKKYPADLEPAARIPPQYKGVATDVLTVRQAIPNYINEDRARHKNLIGGITVFAARSRAHGGTLGFFATIDGAEAPDNIAFVTNAHVLNKHGGKPGDAVYQPDLSQGWNNNSVAKILKIPEIDDYSFQYPPALRLTPGEPAAPYWLDCASAKVDVCISSCCHTNCGESFAAGRIRNLNLPPHGNILQDVARARHNDIVYKVGRTTGRTKGRVSDVAAVVSGGGLTAHGVLEVTFISADEPDVTMFSDAGDSGAAVVREDGTLVGLHYSAAATPDKSLTSHIHPVLATLGLTAITVAHQVTHPAAVDASNQLAIVEGLPSEALRLRDRLLASPRGRRLAALVDRHRKEVVELVNRHRPVTVVWHRNQGPAFTNRVIANARDPHERIPRAVDGIARETLLARMGDVLALHGSGTLRADLAAHREEVLAYAVICDSLHELTPRVLGAPAAAGLTGDADR